jgi:hypothetical protein
MSQATTLTVRVPLAIGRRPGRATVIVPLKQAGQEHVQTTRSDPALMKALARAFRYQKLLDEGRYASITEMAAAEKIERGYLGSLLRLTLLAPAIVETIVGGASCDGIALPALLEPFPVVWVHQNGHCPVA